MRDLARIFKAYDVRGIYPSELDEDVARAVGGAFAGWSGAPLVAIGRDCRISSAPLSEALAAGMCEAGADVIDVGLASTDLVYFVSGDLDIPAVMITASHNPPDYNGLKFCLSGAAPVGEETGLKDIRGAAERGPGLADSPGRVQTREMLGRYVEHVLSFIDAGSLRPMSVVADTANGMGGLVVPAVFERLPLDLIHLFPELDGTFPNHPADPIDPANQEDLKRTVIGKHSDIGLAFDGDADRVFVVDETGRGVSGSLVTAMVARAMLSKNPGQPVVHNLICSRVVPEVILESGGIPVRTRVGHSFIKKVMADTGAIFGGEHSGHYYFRDNYRADSGLIAALIVLDTLSRSGEPLSRLLEPYRRYHASGEINSRVSDQAGKIAELARAFAGGEGDTLDGLTVGYEDWWFNVRPSNTEPLLRLNVEADDERLLEEKTDLLLRMIRGEGGEA